MCKDGIQVFEEKVRMSFRSWDSNVKGFVFA